MSPSHSYKAPHTIFQEQYSRAERRLNETMISTNTCNSYDNFVYLNKIFFNESENASPVMTAFETTAEGFTQQLNIGAMPVGNIGYKNAGCSCNNSQEYDYSGCNCCCDVIITAGTTFNITNTYVIVRSFQPVDPAIITPTDITVEGLPVTAITVNGNQLVADISGIINQITTCACKQPCSEGCYGNYVMITADGPWELAATIVVEGTISGNGQSCQFRLCYSTDEETPITVTGPASFAFCNADIPCQISGLSPTLVFDFEACAKLLNPTIAVTCTDGVCTPILTGALVVTPQINLQVLRPSLFNLGNLEVKLPCDDLGQCNPCNSIEAQCVDLSDSCCCERDRPKDINIACQCCETNGYGF